MMLVIFGPTVTGKTALSIKLAKLLDGRIISADSRQIFKGLDIGSGKVRPEDMVEKHKGYWVVNGIKIYGFDIRDPGKSFSVADFINYSKSTLIRISRVKKLPIVVGGTGFYIKALLYGIETSGIAPNKKLRKNLEQLSAAKLYKKLLLISPKKAKSLNDSDRQNPRRLIRALEIAHFFTTQVKSGPQALLTLGVRKSNLNDTPGVSHGSALVIGLTAPNQFLFQKADLWLEKRLELGLIKEVEGLIRRGVSTKWLDDLGLEYRWIKRYLVDKIPYDFAINRLRGDIHSLIKRQKTFFNQFDNLQMYDISQKKYQEKLVVDLKRLLGRE